MAFKGSHYTRESMVPINKNQNGQLKTPLPAHWEWSNLCS
jgi:hypothetical protein